MISFPKFVPVIVSRTPPKMEPIFGDIEVMFEPTFKYNPLVLINPY